MVNFDKEITLRWSDIDANHHVRHTVYYDLAAKLRTDILAELGLTMKAMYENNFGPVLFREECVFKREMFYGDKVTLTVRLAKAKADYSRWSFRHEFVREDGTVCAVLNIDGAWIDTKIRKLAPPPQLFMDAFEILPKTEDFALVD